MTKSAKKLNKASLQLLIYSLALFLLVLTSININNYLSPDTVLGAQEERIDEEEFWRTFLTNNPNYIPGWIETGREDVARRIDPNYPLGF